MIGLQMSNIVIGKSTNNNALLILNTNGNLEWKLNYANIHRAEFRLSDIDNDIEHWVQKNCIVFDDWVLR